MPSDKGELVASSRNDITEPPAGFQIIDGVPHIGAKAFPWAREVRFDEHETLVYCYRTRGFWLLFENGWTLSVQFGAGNYCANRDSGWGEGEWHEDCPTAEIAAWDVDGEWWEFEHDSVLGWQTTEDVMRWIEFFSTQRSRQSDVATEVR